MCVLQQSKTDLRRDVIALCKYNMEAKKLFKKKYSAGTRADRYKVALNKFRLELNRGHQRKELLKLNFYRNIGS